jgi:hypothetical protein
MDDGKQHRPQPGSPEYELVQQTVSLIAQILDGPRPWPNAVTLLARLEESETVGWSARWSLQLAVDQLRRMTGAFEHEAELNDYLLRVLNDQSLQDAIRGAVKKEDEFKSTIDELFRRSSSYRDSVAFQEMIHFCARFRAYAPFNNMLVKVQNRSCAFYATAKHWMDEFGCRIKEDSRPMLILAPMHPVMLVYDIDSVENPPVPEKLQQFGAVKGKWEPRRIELLLENAERWGIRVEFKPLSSTHGGFATHDLRNRRFKKRIVVHDGLDGPGRYAILCHEMAHILLGHLGTDEDLWWPSRAGLSQQTVEIEAESVSHIVLNRVGLESASPAYLSSYIADGGIPESVSVDLIAKVAAKLEEMSHRLLTAPKTKEQRKARKKSPEQLSLAGT